jgi:predicted ATPase
VPRACECREQHVRRRIVLTGGPGAGKTAVLELIRHSLCSHVEVLPEAAGIVFGGGFPRRPALGARQAAQRAIYHVQRELEAAADANGSAIVLCDRGTLDGVAYWPGPGDFCDAVGTTRSEIFARYDAVIHLRVPDAQHGYDHQNPLRVESADEARAIDQRILEAWSGHPHLHVIDPSHDFMEKARRAIELLRADLPDCCRELVPQSKQPVDRDAHVR